jgi:hypothetical protein
LKLPYQPCSDICSRRNKGVREVNEVREVKEVKELKYNE